MKKALIGLFALSSLSAFSQVIEMKITNKNFPERSITLSCIDNDCAYIHIKTPSLEKTVNQESLVRYSQEKLKRVNGWDEYPFSFVDASYSNTKEKFEVGDVGNGIGNAALTIVAVPVDILYLPFKTAIYLSGKREGIERKRVSKKLLRFIEENRSVETVMRAHQFQKIEEGLDML